MRVAGEAVARQASIENGDFAAGTAELQGAGETGKAAADDDDVIHGDKLRVVDGGGWAGPGAKYRPAIRARRGYGLIVLRRVGGGGVSSGFVVPEHRRCDPRRETLGRGLKAKRGGN